jgi:Fe-S-cluster containining protein
MRHIMANFVCRRCGKCCGLAPFTKADYKAARRAAKNLGVTLAKQYIKGKPVYLPRKSARKMELPPEQIAALVDAEKLVCPFLERDATGKSHCRIYSLRPEACRLFGTHPELSPFLQCPNQGRDYE